MIHIEAEPHFTGTVQHLETNEGEFANAFYEIALAGGYEVEAGIHHNGVHFIDLYGEDADIDCLVPQAQDLAFNRMHKRTSKVYRNQNTLVA